MSTQSSGGASEADNVRRAFAGLPASDKITTFLRIELDMVGDAVEFVVATASKAVDEMVNVCRDVSGSAGSESGQSTAS